MFVFELFVKIAHENIDNYLVICLCMFSSTGGTRLCQFSQSESRNRAAERRRESRP